MDRGSKNVLVIGNGIGGSQFTARLRGELLKLKKEKDISITVLTPLQYSEISLQMTMIVAAGPKAHEGAIFPPFNEDGVEYVYDGCQELREASVLTTSGKIIPFDVAVCASGLNYPIFQAGPDHPTMESRKAFIADLNGKITTTNTVVISGGGPIGCEVAADIKIRNPTKRVVLIHSHEELLIAMSPQFRTIAKETLIKQGVEVVLNDRVVQTDNGRVVTKNGTTFDDVVYIPCHSPKPNTDYAPASYKDSKGYIKVNDTLRSETNPKVFAVGDCSSFDQTKIIPKIDDQLPTVVKNVLATLEGQTLMHHKKGFMGNLQGPLLVSLGHDHPQGHGIGPDIPGCVACICFVCCCLGTAPCSHPHGAGVSKTKSEFNHSIKPTKGKGISK